MIGSNLVRCLVQEGHRVTVVDKLWRGKREYLQDESGSYIIDLDREFYQLDLAVPNQIDSLLDGVDYVCHLAGIVAGVDCVFSNEWSVFQSNMRINMNALQSVSNKNLQQPESERFAKYGIVGARCVEICTCH